MSLNDHLDSPDTRCSHIPEVRVFISSIWHSSSLSYSH